MKLVLCRKCHDVFKLASTTRRCECGEVSGQYLADKLHAVYSGEHAVPIGFANDTLVAAVKNRPKSGWGERFTAFVIAENCETFTSIK